MSHLLDLTALSLLPIWLGRLIGERLRAGDPPAAILERLLVERWPDEPDKRATIRARAATALARAAGSGITPIAWSDAAYPPALAAIIDPPPVLWLRGAAAALERPAVAIVGSRAGSPYALAVAERLAADLSARGIVVVSGLARGVDSAAHRGALRRAAERELRTGTGGGITAGSSGGAAEAVPCASPAASNPVAGSTIAVLGSGVDVIYPAEHKPLAREIEATGAVLSEFVPGTPPNPAFFPQRNRVISGLSRAIVVIEAGEKSGSLITARCALEQGRDVLAVPGSVLSGRNRGAHALLRDGAKIVETADDILEELGPSGINGVGSVFSQVVKGLPPSTDPVLACLQPGEPCDLDAISERSGLAPARLLPRLFELELRGLVGRAGGGRFVRFDRPC
jgi:DNA processing protein